MEFSATATGKTYFSDPTSNFLSRHFNSRITEDRAQLATAFGGSKTAWKIQVVDLKYSNN